jgi:hypothetical protein
MNKQLNRLLAKLERKCKEITPEVYASIAIALHRKYGWGFKRISDLFAESQEVWNECIQSEESMVEMCERLTGIDVQRRVDE